MVRKEGIGVRVWRERESERKKMKLDEGLKESERIRKEIVGFNQVTTSRPTGRISPDRPGGNFSIVFSRF